MFLDNGTDKGERERARRGEGDRRLSISLPPLVIGVSRSAESEAIPKRYRVPSDVADR